MALTLPLIDWYIWIAIGASGIFIARVVGNMTDRERWVLLLPAVTLFGVSGFCLLVGLVRFVTLAL